MQCTSARLPLPFYAVSRSQRPFRKPYERRQWLKTRPHCVSSSEPPLSVATEGLKSQAALDGAPIRVMTFQEAISRLQEYWSSVGCAVWLPHNTEVGAGTMNPATFLRVLGPEPWNVCYPEPSIRPDDSRYGENPNRIQRHTQFQVVLKPDPGNPQELYLNSLEALGIDGHVHDIRFVEDNWESPVLGAWGLGWEVWLDGMEITQFTYFQQAGSLALPVPSIEITYGLERILMSLQNVQHFKDIQYTDSLTYGELLLQTEVEMSQYNMDEAVVSDHWQRFELYRAEAQAMLEKELALPAYDNLLKCSHTFNVLDARGAVGVTERNVCFGVMRKLTRQVASLWLKQRTKMEFPLLKTVPLEPPSETDQSIRSEGGPRWMVLELGCEEMPPADVESALEQLKTGFETLLETQRLFHDGIEVYGTARRLTVLVKDLVGAQTAQDQKMRGPPAKIAYQEDGNPSKALLGFCKKNNCAIDSITTETDAKGVEFVFGIRHEAPLNTGDVLMDKIPELLRSVNFKKSMRWSGPECWSRPIRWILALHGDVPLPLNFAEITASSSTQLLRNSGRPSTRISSAEAYREAIAKSGIILDPIYRREQIWKAVQAAAKEVDGVIPETFSATLLNEVAYLVEAPSVVLGSFSAEFLSLPREVLETVMEKYQRYFPVYSKTDQSAMLPFFVAVGNGDFNSAVVQSGYEDVLRARFKDAQFFYEEDLKQALESYRPKLAGTQFHKDLGNLLEKSERTEKLIGPFCALMGLQTAQSVAQRAAEISRADLATALVTEMTSLAGTMGRHYALKSGEGSDVAEAVFEAALPRFAGDRLPVTPAGLAVSVADKMDSLVGLVAVKCAPSATADPYGLRRMAYGLVEALIEGTISFNLHQGIQEAAALQPTNVTEDIQEEAFMFIRRRLEQLLLDRGVTPEVGTVAAALMRDLMWLCVVRSVLAERDVDPYSAAEAARALMEHFPASIPSPFMTSVINAIGRATRITKGKNLKGSVDPSLFQQEEETALWNAYLTTQTKMEGLKSVSVFLEVCHEGLVSEIDAFFDAVFVMCEDPALSQNRLQLLSAIAQLPHSFFDFSELPGF